MDINHCIPNRSAALIRLSILNHQHQQKLCRYARHLSLCVYQNDGVKMSTAAHLHPKRMFIHKGWDIKLEMHKLISRCHIVHHYVYRLKHTHTTSSSAFSLSSFWKSSLLTMAPPPLSLQPLDFQVFTQLVMPFEIQINIYLIRVINKYSTDLWPDIFTSILKEK